ncbi:MAG: DUF4340 domain-containing protein [Phycisphaerales bacterium]|nr:DUF4340 domain-containing protein [Phycisphaerales bacterium]
MNNARFIRALVISVIALVALAVALRMRAHDPIAPPELDQYLNSIAPLASKISAIELHSGETPLRIEKGSEGWTVASRAGFPAKAERVQELVRGLIALDADQKMTAKLERLHELGLAWPDANKESTRVQIFVMDSDQPVLDVIIGRAVQSPAGVYVRRSGENQSYRCTGSLRVAHAIEAWIASPVSDIPASAIGQINVDGLTLTQQAGQWSFVEPTGEADARRDALKATMPFLLSGFAPEDVRIATTEDLVHSNQIAVILHLDAEHAVDARVWKEGDGVWVRLALGECASTPHETLDAYAPMWQGWVFRLPSWRGAQFEPLFAPIPDPTTAIAPIPSP